VDVSVVYNFEIFPSEQLYFRGLEVSLRFSVEGNTETDEVRTILGDPVENSR